MAKASKSVFDDNREVRFAARSRTPWVADNASYLDLLYIRAMSQDAKAAIAAPAGAMTETTGSHVLVPQAAVSAAIFRDGKVLLVKRGRFPAKGVWSLPGGHIELGEPAIDAVHRELAEETGITANIIDIAAARDAVHRNDRGAVIFHRVIIVFYGVWAAGEVIAASDAEAAAWHDLDAVATLATTDGLAAVIAAAADRLGKQEQQATGFDAE